MKRDEAWFRGFCDGRSAMLSVVDEVETKLMHAEFDLAQARAEIASLHADPVTVIRLVREKRP